MAGVAVVLVLLVALFALGITAVYGLLLLWVRASEEKEEHKEGPVASRR